MSLTCYAPFRRSPSACIATDNAAPRLACVKPAASVHPEPGSNSSLYNLPDIFIFSCRFRPPGLPLKHELTLSNSLFWYFISFCFHSLVNDLSCSLSGFSLTLSSAHFPNGIAKVHLFSLPPNFFPLFFRLFLIFFFTKFAIPWR